MIGKKLNFDEEKLGRYKNVEVMRMEVELLSALMSSYKTIFCRDRSLNYETEIDVSNRDFLYHFFREYLYDSCNYKLVYRYLHNMYGPTYPSFNPYYLVNKRGERFDIKMRKLPNVALTEIEKQVLSDRKKIAEILEKARIEFCRKHSLGESEMVDVCNDEFLVFLFQEYGKDINTYGGYQLYHKIDVWHAFMNR